MVIAKEWETDKHLTLVLKRHAARKEKKITPKKLFFREFKKNFFFLNEQEFLSTSNKKFKKMK